jgi:putative FmdB family regulatory protein
MPIYEYRCEKCGEFEYSQRITAPALQRCPTCKRKVRRLISNTSFQLKGSGWYVTDYARAGGGKDKDKDKDKKSGTSDGKGESGSGGGSESSAKSESGKSDGGKSDGGKSESGKSEAKKSASA